MPHNFYQGNVNVLYYLYKIVILCALLFWVWAIILTCMLHLMKKIHRFSLTQNFVFIGALLTTDTPNRAAQAFTAPWLYDVV